VKAFLPALLSLCLLSCVPPLDESPVVPQGPASIRLSPDSSSAGVPRNVSIVGVNTDWRPGEVEVDFGPGVDVPVLLVDSSYHLTAQVFVADGAALGPRDVEVRWRDRSVTAYDGFYVEEGSLQLAPARASLGETTIVEITGWGTRFQPSYTVVSFGTEVEIEHVEVISSSRLRVTIHVPHRASPGPVDVAVYNPGAELYTLHHGFLVDRRALTMTITPDEADQSETVEARIFADGATFVQGATEVDLGTGVVTEAVAVTGPEQLIATLRIGNNAVVGPRDVEVRTVQPEGDPEIRLLLDGFTIYPVDADPLRARASLSFGIARTFDQDDCEFAMSVYASATFYEPNDFPCPSSGAFSTMAAPPHFDLAGTGHTMTNGSTDCPPTKTFDAGPQVWFDGPDNSIELTRTVHPYNGRISYRAVDLDLPDYHTDTVYDLRTPGGDIGYNELPAWQIPTVITTLPRVYSQHTPEYCALDVSLDGDLTVTWDPAETYDESEMYLYVIGSAQQEGVPVMMVYPWDDGEFTYSSDMLGFFSEGPAMLLQNAYRQTRFDVPGSEYVNAGFGTSQLLWRGTFRFVE